MPEYWDVTDKPDPENIRRILTHLATSPDVPGAALDAIEGLLKLAYPGEMTKYTCRICGAEIETPMRPGKRPANLCKKTNCQKEANRQRVATYRARHK